MIKHNGRIMPTHLKVSDDQVKCKLPMHMIWALSSDKSKVTCKRCLNALKKEKKK